MERDRGRRIRQAFEMKGIRKHSVIAAALRVTEGAVSRWCHGGPMTLANVIGLCEYLDISVDWLLLGRGHVDQHQERRAIALGEFALVGVCERARPHLIRFLQEAAQDCDAPSR